MTMDGFPDSEADRARDLGLSPTMTSEEGRESYPELYMRWFCDPAIGETEPSVTEDEWQVVLAAYQYLKQWLATVPPFMEANSPPLPSGISRNVRISSIEGIDRRIPPTEDGGEPLSKAVSTEVADERSPTSTTALSGIDDLSGPPRSQADRSAKQLQARRDSWESDVRQFKATIPKSEQNTIDSVIRLLLSREKPTYFTQGQLFDEIETLNDSAKRTLASATKAGILTTRVTRGSGPGYGYGLPFWELR
jgi:hypothetical protein